MELSRGLDTPREVMTRRVSPRWLAPFSALGESKGGRCLLGPGWCDSEEFEDAALCVGEAVELDAGVCVGEAESLEDAEDVTSGGFR